MTFEHRSIQNDDVTLHSAATGSGAPIIFLHGFPEFWRVWHRVIGALSTRYRCIAPDLRGFNLSAKPIDPNRYRLSFAIQDVLAIANAYHCEKFTLVGHDWGGLVSWRFAERHPERLQNLVVLNAPHPDLFQNLVRTDPGQREAAQYARRLSQKNSAAQFAPDGARSIWDRFYAADHANGVFDDDDRTAFLAAWNQPSAIDRMINWYRSGEICVPSMSEPYTPEDTPVINSLIATPTLVLWGDKDPLFMPRLVNDLSSVASNLTVKHYDDTGHGIVHEKPHAVAAEIDAFIKSSK